MKNYFSKRVLAIALFTSLIIGFCISSAYADSTPKGKPFVAINDQIVVVEGAISSIRDQIEILVGRVDTVEEKVVASEAAIANLQDQNETLSTLVYQNVNDIIAIEAEIITLQDANSDLQYMIEANSSDIDALKLEIVANGALIATLQSAILLIDSDVISIETSLQDQIDNNLLLIGALQDQIDGINEAIADKQDLVNGICPDTQAIGRINPDGSVVCNSPSTSTTLETYRVWQWFNIPPIGSIKERLFCDDGDLAMSSSYHTYDVAVQVLSFHVSAYGGKLGGYFSAQNIDYTNNSMMALIVCVRGADRISDNP